MQTQLRLSKGVTLVFILALIISALGLMVTQPPPRVQAAPGFVERCGIHFCLNGQPFYFGGANTYDVFTFGDGASNATQQDIETRYMDKARIDAHFARLAADKVTVLRLWMFSHETWHGFEPTKGVYNEAEFALFDYIIESAKAHNVMLIPVFENYWEAYGGIDTRLAWEGLTGGHPGRAKFFNKSVCPGCFTSYKNYVNYALNRTNHYSGVKYKDEPIIFGWELMNEPRYQGVSPEEDVNGTTLRAWVDEMGAYIKGIDSNHILGAGIEGHESRYGFGGDEGNPFIYIQQSPYIDFTSAHPYPTETWANLSIAQTQALVQAWIDDSHNVIGKPFYLGEFNTHTGVRSDWWTAIFGQMQTGGGDGTGFWWYEDHDVDTKFGVMQGAPELAVFRQHSDAMKAKSGPQPTRTPTRTPNPMLILKAQYMTANTGATTGQITAHIKIVNTGVGMQTVPMSELKARYWFTTDTAIADQYGCLYAGSTTPGCANVVANIITVSPARPNADRYLELGFTAGAGSILPYASSSGIENRLNKSDWSSYTQTNDYSFDGTKTAYADWNKVTIYRNGMLVWGVEPGGTVTPPPPTNTPTRTATGTPVTVVPTNTPTRTNTPATVVPTNTPTRTSAVTNTPTRTPTRTATGPTPTRTRTRTPTRTPTGGTPLPTNTPTRTSVVPTNTPTRTSVGPTSTPTRTSTTGPTPTPTPTTGGACSPVTSTITAPFTFDGAGTFCWQSSNLGGFINSWNTTSVSLNGVNVTNVYVAAASYPPQIGGYWYVSYNSTVAWGHFETK